MSLRKWIRGWLSADLVIPEAPQPVDSSTRESAPMCRVSVLKAMNGRVLEVGSYKPNPRGPDWTFELFIVPENATLASAIATVLAIKQIEA